MRVPAEYNTYAVAGAEATSATDDGAERMSRAREAAKWEAYYRMGMGMRQADTASDEAKAHWKAAAEFYPREGGKLRLMRSGVKKKAADVVEGQEDGQGDGQLERRYA